MIYKVLVKPEWLTQAKKEASDMGALWGSITGGAGNLCAFVGEISTHSLIGGERKNTKDYDLVKPPWLIDVKTKRCTSEPKPMYDCSVADFNTTQDCTHYVFTRVLETDYSTCWILGYMPRDEYYQAARFCKKGEVDTNDRRGWRFKADCYNLEIAMLKDIKDLMPNEDVLNPNLVNSFMNENSGDYF
jgi:hypothetical protein